jgi:hypothetical protein
MSIAAQREAQSVGEVCGLQVLCCAVLAD